MITKLSAMLNSDLKPSNLEKINLIEAAVAHIKWRSALKLHICGEPSMDNLAEAGVVNSCGLGRWLHSAGVLAVGNLPLLQQLQEDHAEFHRHVATILDKVKLGELTEAEFILDHDFSRYQRRLLMRITELNELLNQQN